ncbi:NADH-quinone oxidoreductase subunit N [Nitrosococcus watsonii]|uniref:NADH-quinone oxidoreductase subunit N n=1 Tax=Nitrosococcus watsoni (strain C-113) TaxID=105559 RepID=D8K782_NITWC|nr:NADH-quinone oxidoreductase subunit N [Nitrosococcus watsonii]ADJ28759.1 proton-translocating NADH-quinone oxidoreductase, chain N [Nitrosococcus watsonii C-113]
MTSTDFIALSPLIMITLAPLVLALAIAIHRQHRFTMMLTLTLLTLCLIMLPLAASVAPHRVSSLFILDQYALFYMGLIFAAALAVTLLAYHYLKELADQQEEFYVLLLLATLGAAALTASNHFASLLLGLEILSVALFALLAYPRRCQPSLEAGVKYLIVSGTSSAVLLFGMALIYAGLGSMEFERLGAISNSSKSTDDVFFLAGLALIIAGLGFKVSFVPFHLWTPDVYQGAPAPITAFLATVSKGAVFALLLRLFVQVDGPQHHALMVLFSAISVATILAGNLLALLQTNIKRILAYSSIAHLGYLLVALLAGGNLGVEAVTFYWVAYFIMNLGAFGVVTVLSSAAQEKQHLEDYRGLFWHRPGLAGIFTFMLLSLAGIPLTVGFIGKFYIFAVGVEATLWFLLFTMVIGSILGLFYYLRIIIALYQTPTIAKEALAAPSALPLPLMGNLTLILLVLLLIWWGIYPDPLMRMLHAVAITLV